MALRRLAIPICGILEVTLESLGTEIEVIVKGDAQVAEKVIEAGRSKALRYMRKSQRVSIHFMHDILQMPGHAYEHEPSATPKPGRSLR